jgi:hypothetical protein
LTGYQINEGHQNGGAWTAWQFGCPVQHTAEWTYTDGEASEGGDALSVDVYRCVQISQVLLAVWNVDMVLARFVSSRQDSTGRSRSRRPTFPNCSLRDWYPAPLGAVSIQRLNPAWRAGGCHRQNMWLGVSSPLPTGRPKFLLRSNGMMSMTVPPLPSAPPSSTSACRCRQAA